MTQLPPDLPPAWKPPHTPGRPPHQHGPGRRGVAGTGLLAGLIACLTCRCGQQDDPEHDRKRSWCEGCGECGGDGCGDCCGGDGCCDGCDCCSCDCSC